MNEGEDDDDDNSYKFEAPEYYNMGSLIHTLRALSVDSSRRQSKSSRAEQKSVFRDIVKSVEEGYSPSQEIKIGTRTLLFKGWCKLWDLSLLLYSSNSPFLLVFSQDLAIGSIQTDHWPRSRSPFQGN